MLTTLSRVAIEVKCLNLFIQTDTNVLMITGEAISMQRDSNCLIHVLQRTGHLDTHITENTGNVSLF